MSRGKRSIRRKRRDGGRSVSGIHGMLVGTYRGHGADNRLKVEIDQRNPPLLTALFTFYPVSRLPDTNSDSFSLPVGRTVRIIFRYAVDSHQMDVYATAGLRDGRNGRPV